MTTLRLNEGSGEVRKDKLNSTHALCSVDEQNDPVREADPRGHLV